ncbi:Pre-mRNA splicing factor ATP-dependent RNA helicase PRP16 [Pyrenophora tritici-repentis]|nr:Pre-mRNA splicing factor ATP-dependent RNA helicase PRP16 [Pyrenophora tritici-repentis]
MSVAKRVATEYGCRVGREVGYSVRFESSTSEHTKIEYMTDGLLLRQCLSSVLLEDYSAIIIDEAHERTLSTEILMALLKDICAVRPEFRLIIASATLVASEFSNYFGTVPVLNVPGRLFPITKAHTSAPEANYVAAAVSTTFQLHLSQELPGDILIFLTGEDEILLAQEQIESTARSRKVVIATNIAETSLTIDGIRFTIDCGLQKVSQYNPRNFMNALVVEPCSRASADQRAGRAGRTGPGMAFRLYTKHAFYNELPESTDPEILRTSLDGTILMLKAMGINDVLKFDFMAKPPSNPSSQRSKTSTP